MTNLIEEMEAEAARAREEFDGSSLRVLGTLALELDTEIREAEEQLKAKKRKLERMFKFAIPAALAEADIDEFAVKHDGGEARIKLDTKVVGSLRNAPDEEAAVEFLETSGLSGVVRTKIELDFTEEEREAAEELLPQLESLTGKHPLLARAISPQTLMAFARQKLAEDPTWDFERVGLSAFPMARFTKRR